MFYAAAVFVLHKAAGALRQQREPLYCASSGKYSYSILLIHWGVLHYAVKQVLHVNVLSGGIVGGCLLAITSHVCSVVCRSRHFGSDHHPFLTFAVSKLIDVLRTCFPKISYSILEHRRDRRGAV